MNQRVWTIGHSNRTWEEFIAAIDSVPIEIVADVRKFAGSRRNPQFSGDALSSELSTAGIGYRHFPNLGGRRSSRLDPSPNTAWQVAAFQAYADYMLTAEFAAAFEDLVALAQEQRTALMCAEVLPWRCHRRLLADQFVVRGWKVVDIIDARQSREHELPPFARVGDGRLTYPSTAL